MTLQMHSSIYIFSSHSPIRAKNRFAGPAANGAISQPCRRRRLSPQWNPTITTRHTQEGDVYSINGQKYLLHGREADYSMLWCPARRSEELQAA